MLGLSNILRTVKALSLFRRIGLEGLRNILPTEDPLIEKQFDFLYLMGEVGTLTGDLDVHVFAVSMSILQMLRHGGPKSPVVSIAALGILFAALGDYEKGTQVCEIAYSTIDETTPLSRQVEAKMMGIFFVDHWTKPLTGECSALGRVWVCGLLTNN